MKNFKIIFALLCCFFSTRTIADQLSPMLECEVNFVVNRNSYLIDYQATIAVSKYKDITSLINQVKKSIEENGFQVDSEETINPNMAEITFLPNKQMHDDWLAMTAIVKTPQQSNEKALIALQSFGDNSIKQQTTSKMKSFMCGFLTNLPNVKMSDTSNIEQADSIERGAPPQGQDNRRIVRPKAELDVTAAQNALQPGSATIKGKACTTNTARGQTFRDYLRNKPVTLFPLTPYLEEVISLYENSPPTDLVLISSRIEQMRIQGRTNDKGEFEFTRLKPGRYIILAEHTTSGVGTFLRYEGSNTVVNGQYATTTNYYSEHEFYASWENILKDKVTISKPDETVTISLTPPLRIQGLLGDLFNRGKQKGTFLRGLTCSEWLLK